MNIKETQNARLDAIFRTTDPLAGGSLDGERVDRALDAIGAAIVRVLSGVRRGAASRVTGAPGGAA